MNTHYTITQDNMDQFKIPFDNFYKDIIHPKFEEYKSFYEPCGKEHYRLLSYLSTLFNNSTIIDIGTNCGKSAISLSYNPTNVVHTFDVENRYIPIVDNISNIHFHNENIFDNEVFMNWSQTIMSCSFIFVDLEPHNGLIEMKLVRLLNEIGYSGFVVWDDIWYFKEMRNNFWYQISDKIRYDFTLLGHWSGTGITSFNSNITFNKNDNSRWTLVTAYFDITRFDDATNEIKERDDLHYMSNAISTMSLPYNLIVYCEKSHLDILRLMRPSYLRNRVLYRIVDFDKLYFRKYKHSIENKDSDCTFSKYREIIKKNRMGNPYYVENRNTPSYYLLCMARYIMMKETIETNPFSSSHFSWINICIERMGYTNLVHLDESLSLYRDKFSTCYIDYIPENIVNNIEEYYKWGRCGMCSGFFTGNSHYMWSVSNLIENKFIEYIYKGYGHADEQLYSPVYFENPEQFEHYYGDYNQMITNYSWVYESPRSPILNFIRNSFDNCNYVKCYEACKYVWQSYCKGKCSFNFDEKLWLSYYYMMSQKECLGS
jgi:hypothetical protein